MKPEVVVIETERDTVTGTLYGSNSDIGVLFAHGAGAGQHHAWMVEMAGHLAAQGHLVMTFDYAYTAQGRKAPDRMPRLTDVHHAAIDVFSRHVGRIVLAGKSMGSRVGSYVVDERNVDVAGLVAYSYPVVPPGKTEPRPTDHLERISHPQLFFAGTRDRLSPPPVMETIVDRLQNARLVVIEDADHSFRVPKRSPITSSEVFAGLAATTAGWIADVVA